MFSPNSSTPRSLAVPRRSSSSCFFGGPWVDVAVGVIQCFLGYLFLGGDPVLSGLSVLVPFRCRRSHSPAGIAAYL